MRLIAAVAALGVMAYTAHALQPVPTQTQPTSVRIPDPMPVEAVEQQSRRYDVPLSDELQEYIVITCQAADPPVPVEIVLAIIEHESGFDSNAVGYNDNGTTDHGLMQINSVNHEWIEIELGLTDMHNPRHNIAAGVHILSGLIEDEGSVNDALMAYQCGPARARELREQGVTETAFSRWVIEKTIEMEG